MSETNIVAELENLPKPPKKKKKFPFQIILAIIILALALALSRYYMATPPRAKPQRRPTIAPLVEVISAKFESHRYTFRAMGTVITSQAVELKPRVQGPLLAVSPQFTPGGFFKKGEVLASIDPQDYRLALAQLQSEVAKARADLNLEMGKQLVAEKEFQLLGKKVRPNERELMLRKPQLEAARATLLATQAKKELAEMDLNNTKVRAPFNAVLISKSADPGSRVTPATSIAHLAGTDTFLIRITLPQNKLRWLSSEPESGFPLQILMQDGNRSGTLTNISSKLEEGSRMAVVYAEVDDPLCRKPGNQNKPKLLLDSFVQVEITGPLMKEVVALDRSYLRDNDTIWLLNKEGKRVVRSVEVAARSQDKIYIRSGIEEGELIVVSNIAFPESQREPQQTEKEEKSLQAKEKKQ